MPRNIILNALRRLFSKSKAKTTVKQRARVSRGQYKCEKCNKKLNRHQFEIDHIDPCIPVSGFDSWDGVISRMFVEADGLQLLCKKCHSNKTVKENSKRNSKRNK